MNQAPGPLPDGHHPSRYDYTMGNRGCKGGPCHSGGNGPFYAAAGAVYSQLEDGGEPVAGAHIYITDSTGREFHTVTAMNGFFWITDTGMTPPLQTVVTLCPDRKAMVMEAPSGNCNGGSACHVESNKISVTAP